MKKLIMNLGDRKQLEILAEQLCATGDSDFNEMIAALYQLVDTMIERTSGVVV